MFRTVLVAAFVSAAIAIPAGANAHQSPFVPRLDAKVSQNAISLRTSTGALVTKLTTGTYEIRVTAIDDQNFHLSGPGVNRKNGLDASPVWQVKLLPGRYVYESDINSRLVRSFTVSKEAPA